MKKQILIIFLLLSSIIVIFTTAFAKSVNINLSQDEETFFKIKISSNDENEIQAGTINLLLGDGVNLAKDDKSKPICEITKGYEMMVNANNNYIVFNQNSGSTSKTVEMLLKVNIDEQKDVGAKIDLSNKDNQIIIDYKKAKILTENSTLAIGSFIQESNNEQENNNQQENNNEQENDSEKDKNQQEDSVTGNSDNTNNSNVPIDESNSGSNSQTVTLDTTMVKTDKLSTKEGTGFGDKNIIILVCAMITFIFSVIALIKNVCN